MTLSSCKGLTAETHKPGFLFAVHRRAISDVPSAAQRQNKEK